MADDSATSDDVTSDPIHGKDKKSKQQRMLIIIGVAGLILTFFLLRRNASSSGQAAVTTGTDQALAQYEQQNAGDLAGLQGQLQSLQAQMAGLSPTMGSGDGQPGTPQPPITINVGGSSGSPSPSPSSTPAGGLPPVNASAYPKEVLFGQYAPSDYTKIGTVTNGTYSGEQVGGGVPVYAGLFGGMEQGFNMGTLPSGTDLYIPSQFTAYEHA